MRRVLLVVIDVLLIFLATLAAGILRNNLDVSIALILTFLPYALLSAVVAIPVWLSFGHDRTFWRFSGLPDYLSLLAGCALVVIVSVAIGFLVSRQEGVPRALPVLQFLLMSFFLVGARTFSRLHHLLRHAPPAKNPDGTASVLLVGLSPLTDFYIRCLSEFGPQVQIAGLLGRSEHHNGRLLQHYKVLGIPENVEGVLQELGVHGVTIDRLVVTTAPERLSAGARIALEKASAARRIPLEYFSDHFGAGRLAATEGDSPAEAGSAQAVRVDTKSVEHNLASPYWAIKRTIDIVVSGAALVVAVPLMGLVTLLILATIGYPAIFWQQRPGLNGRPFRLYKFRTMGSAYDAAGRRVPEEKRVNWVGRILRRSRIDELPQLINIFIGNMSFVGPRPLLPADQSHDFHARLLVRPGLTGWAQVCGGRVIDATNKAALDVWYVCNASLLLDVKIVLGTIPMLLRGDQTNIPAVQQAWSDLRNQGVLVGGTAPEVAAKFAA